MSNLIKDWTNAEIDRVASSFKRSRYFIKSLKLTFPVVAFGLILALLVYPRLYPEQKKFSIQPVEITNEQDIPAMVNPKFSGFDKDNQPFSLTAAKAYPQEDKTVLLQDVIADITLKNGMFASIVTPMGYYSVDAKMLELDDVFDVYVTESNAKTYHMAGSGLSVDLNTQTIKSNQKVSAQTPMGTLDASGFVLYKEQGKITFHGPVKLIIRK